MRVLRQCQYKTRPLKFQRSDKVVGINIKTLHLLLPCRLVNRIHGRNVFTLQVRNCVWAFPHSFVLHTAERETEIQQIKLTILLCRQGNIKRIELVRLRTFV